MNSYEVNGIDFAYDEKLILKNVSLKIKKGTLTCLLGNNGCGKTTLLDCLLGLNKPQKGQIILNGQELNHVPINKRASYVSYIPQYHDANFPYTVTEIVQMGRSPYLRINEEISKDHAYIVEDALHLMGIWHLKDRIYTKLSGGEMKLVLFARAYVQATEIILMDEPTASLDLGNEQLILDRIYHLINDKKKTLIMSSHSLNHTLFLDSKGLQIQVLMIKEGEIKYEGRVKDTINEENIYNTYGVKTKIIDYKLESGQAGRTIISL